MFQHVEAYPGDPILSLNEAFGKDTRPGKINVSIGIYFDDNGKIPMLPSVRAAEHKVVNDAGARPYLPMEGADRKSTRLNSSHSQQSRMPSSA